MADTTERITLAHGSGGRSMHELIGSLFMKELANEILAKKTDSAIITHNGKKFAFTTDSYVVSPIFFPGGDIGSLAVHGTVNDLAVCGAKPLYLSLGLVIEEGFPKTDLARIVKSIGRAVKEAGVKIVTGDTKVVGRGACDKIFINTSGIGEIYYEGLSVDSIRTGDMVLVSGNIGDHAISVLSQREGFDFTGNVKSDSAPLNGLIKNILNVSKNIRFMRDPTRGGLATTLNEMVERRKFGILIREKDVPVGSGVRQACELLGFDPLYLACEGRVIVIVKKEDADKVLGAMKKAKYGKAAKVIGVVTDKDPGKVVLETISGGKRMVGMLSGEQLPRIC